MSCSIRRAVIPVTIERGRFRSWPISERETGWLRKIYRSTRAWLESCRTFPQDFVAIKPVPFLSGHVQRESCVFGGHFQHAVNVQIGLELHLVPADMIHDCIPLLLRPVFFALRQRGQGLYH